MNDLIDRQAALDIFKPWLDVKGYSEGELNMLRAVIYELETMPSTSAWVSVKDRLSEKDVRVLVYTRNRFVSTLCHEDIDYLEENGKFYRYNGNQYISHWMPLPEPPKESTNE